MIEKERAIGLLDAQLESGRLILRNGANDVNKWLLDSTAIFERVFGKGLQATRDIMVDKMAPDG